MPTLNWIGKKAVETHHREVPFRLLEAVPELSCAAGGGNLLVEGDNLLALKALLPRYAGQVKCVYIDPPYNTGNEGWAYNDKVNSPEIRKWMNEVVGKEGETLDRHDRWLTMMYPRLVLLKRFLREDGVIFVSIDDFEAHHLRVLMDEVFGAVNFIAQLVWDKTRKNDAKLFSVGHEYMLVFARSMKTLKEQKTVWREQKPGARDVIAKWRTLVAEYGENYNVIQNALREWYRTLDKNHPAKKLSRTRWVDQYGPWRDRDISWPGGGGPRYDVIHPITKLPCTVPERGWGFATIEEMQRQIDLGLVVFRNDHTEPPMRKAHLMPVPGENGNFRDGESDSDVDDSDAGLLVMPSLIQKQAQVSVKLLREIFSGKKVFENPKDHEVIARLIAYVTQSGDIILDSFAGSGTTGHAVLKQNAEDGGSRRFILVEMDKAIARNVTAERLKRATEGYTNTRGETVAGLSGGFQFCRLSTEPLFTHDGAIRPDVSFAQLAEFVWFMETGAGHEPPQTGEANPSETPEPTVRPMDARGPYLGLHRGRAVFLLYNGILKDKSDLGGNVLNSRTLTYLKSRLPEGFSGPMIVHGARSRFDKARLAKMGVTFHQLPYALAAKTWF
jgi:adenine-specific DNA-methyltransferase